jgi:RNA polymerase sigma-70 factor (ECF subfamily)
VNDVADLDLSFDELYRRYFSFVWRILKRLGVPAEQVEDGVQEVFVVVHRRRDAWTHGSARSWLFGIARRVASDVRRSRSRGDRRLRAVADVAPRRSEPNGRIEAADFVSRVLAQMDPAKRIVFILSDVEGMTAKEIHEALDLNVNTIYARLGAARKQFKQLRAEAEASRDVEKTNP